MRRSVFAGLAQSLGVIVVGLSLVGGGRAQQPPPDGEWTADAVVAEARAVTDNTLGAAQGVAVREGKIYAYGDVHTVTPRVGVIREFGMDLAPTGRVVWLRRGGSPFIIHPTGLTWDPHFGTFLGDTIKSPEDPRRTKAKIYRLDWERAWADGHLDNSVIDALDDDAAVNGCRPTFVKVAGRTLLATADYGSIRPEIRLYDPELFLDAKRSSAPGVVVHRILSGPYNQNLHWDAELGRLTCVQNVIEGRGWRLEVLDLARGVADGRVSGPGVRVQSFTFVPHDELEGYWPIDRQKSILITSSRRDNMVVGTIRPTDPRISPPVPPSAETN
ncbi:hypothetical protein [Singulisphaera sp. PoT]|uniref:hypothetical protein n=1 Tax=Singulisphaera sp. PoT TaxID=3411797 RepID=UPI003BF528DA